MRIDLTINQRLFVGCLISGALLSVLAAWFASPGPLGGVIDGTSTPFVPGIIYWLGFAVSAGLLSLAVWGSIFGSAWRAIRRMRKQIQQRDPSAPLTVPSLGLLEEVALLEESLSSQSTHSVRSDEIQRLLISDVAHELCSPLARMQRALSLAERHVSGDALPYMQKLENELQHVTRLVEETLSFSKISALPEAEPIQAFFLKDLFDSVLARESSETGVETDFPKDLLIHSRRSALERAVANLVRNAVRYAGDFGPIELQAHASGDFVSISVRDSGPGLQPELLEKIFQPFYRPDSARQRRTGGAGLGLAIVRSCVEACGGSVSAKLLDPKGMEFEIRLPYVQ